ncbi:hypothetical protein F5X96DRAFT_664942 [Biscogniauxia mediterranea]|nr:hypothetical protein F5X96DRAFT_664942 [Biscogniauxia mediterranea]
MYRKIDPKEGATKEEGTQLEGEKDEKEGEKDEKEGEKDEKEGEKDEKEGEKDEKEQKKKRKRKKKCVSGVDPVFVHRHQNTQWGGEKYGEGQVGLIPFSDQRDRLHGRKEKSESEKGEDEKNEKEKSGEGGEKKGLEP